MSKKPVDVLIVDDEAAACQPLERFLKKKGYETKSVHDGLKAVERVEKSPPDIVLLDIKMPGLNGIETLKKIRKTCDFCIVIMLTAVDDTETALTCIKEGAYDFLRKPVVLAELLHAIESSLEKRRLIQENLDYQKNLEKKVEEQTAALKAINEYLRKTNLDIVRALSEAIEAKDPYTRGHCSRVTSLSLSLGRQVGLDEKQMEALEYGALLHDIGKIGIRGAVLNKPDVLTKEEFKHIQTHPVIGDNIVSNVDFLKIAKEVTRSHHERADGKGYPDGLSNEQIGILARIAIIADAFDAMTSDRPYREGMPVEKAINIIEKNKGKQFDPELSNIFIEKKLYLE